MPVAWDSDLLLKSVVPPFPEIKMSSDAADSTDTRHEPDHVEPGKEGLRCGGQVRDSKDGVERKEKGGMSAGSFSLCFACLLLCSSNQPGS